MHTEFPVYFGLDFDGVLHHKYAGPYKEHCQVKPFDHAKFMADVAKANGPENGSMFDRMHHLEALLEALPTAKIVITTSWRYEISLDDLRKFFPPAVQERIIDAIGLHESCNDSAWGIRGNLMAQWAEERRKEPGEESLIWIALEDDFTHYEKRYQHLVVTDRDAGILMPEGGMDEQTVRRAIEEVDEWILAMHQSLQKKTQAPSM